jgi:hypothetical protein
VKTDDDVHLVLLDRVERDLSEICLLISVIEFRAWEIDPGGVGGGNPKGIDVLCSQLVDVCGCDKARVTGFEDRPATRT